MGHVWLGFEPGELVEWLGEAGFEAARVTPLPLESAARGPQLFVASARRAADKRRRTNHKRRTE